jgi:hypothetical protein
MSSLVFDFQWRDGSDIRAPELAATYAELLIECDGCSVTRVYDKRSRSVRSTLLIPLYPLAEWIAYNWWALTNEIENPFRRGDQGYVLQHTLDSGRQGYGVPRLSFHCRADRFRIEWQGYSDSDLSVDFLNTGAADLDRNQVTDALFTFVESVVARLTEDGVTGTPLQDEWSAIQALSDEERAFCRLAGMLGADPFNLGEDERHRILSLENELTSDLLVEFCATANAATLEEALELYRHDASLVEARGGRSQRLESIRVRTPMTSFGPPWQTGYAAARHMRAQLGLDGAIIGSRDRLHEILDIPQSVAYESSASRYLDGVIGIKNDASIGCVLHATNERSRFFTFARMLLEYAYSTSPGMNMLTHSNSVRQSINRAFAAEFLAPARSIESRLSDVADTDQVQEIADEFDAEGHLSSAMSFPIDAGYAPPG